MKTKLHLYLLLFSLAALSLLPSCKENDDVVPTPDPTVSNEYLLGGSYGDLISFKIDQTNKKYHFFNETNNASDSGNYMLSSHPKLQGVYEFLYDNSTYYGIELPGKMFVTSVSSGNQKNTLCFGINGKQDLNSSINKASITGKYLWVTYNKLDDFEWGGFELFDNGTYTWQMGPDDDNDFDVTKHFAGGGNGTWKISPSNASRIEFSEGGSVNIGSVLNGNLMLIDNGVDKGFTAGVKYPSAPVTQESLAGNYKWLDVTPEGYRGVGYFNIPASGNSVEYFYKYYNNPFASEGLDTMYNFRRSNKINNAFIGEDTFEGDTFKTSFLTLPGQTMLFYSWGDNGMVSYGVAGKVD